MKKRVFTAIIYFLPIVVAASNLSLRWTLATCMAAALLFFSQLPPRMFLDPKERHEELPGMLVFGVTFFIVGLLVQSFSEQHSRQLLAQKTLNQKLLDNQAALKESLLRLEKAEEDLRRKERLAALGEMSAGIAHEIRNPLGIISSSAQLIDKKLPEEADRVRSLLDIIQEESTRINGLVTDFLSFGRPNQPARQVCDLKSLLQRVVDHVAAMAQQQGVEVVVEENGTPFVAMVDPDMLQQVLLNLFLNALNAAEAGGHVRARICQDGPSVCIDVEDDGCGISPENQARVFDPFFTTKDRGTGLGLANAYRIVEAHGGDLKVFSEEGKGVCFSICLPVEDA